MTRVIGMSRTCIPTVSKQYNKVEFRFNRVQYLVQVQFVRKLPGTNADCQVLFRVKCRLPRQCRVAEFYAMYDAYAYAE